MGALTVPFDDCHLRCAVRFWLRYVGGMSPPVTYSISANAVDRSLQRAILDVCAAHGVPADLRFGTGTQYPRGGRPTAVSYFFLHIPAEVGEEVVRLVARDVSALIPERTVNVGPPVPSVGVLEEDRSVQEWFPAVRVGSGCLASFRAGDLLPEGAS